MECKVCRTALSARIDGERETVPAPLVDAHLEGCAECCSWYAAAVELSGQLRGTSVPAPDLTAAIFAAADLERPRWSRLHRWTRPPVRLGAARILLALLGIAQVGLALAQFGGLDFGMSHHHGAQATRHLINESTAWSLAIGIGVLYCALRPRATSGVLPVLGVLVVALTAFVAGDLYSGVVPVSRVLSHLVLVAALVLVAVVHRMRRSGTSPPAREALPAPTELVLPPGARLGRRTAHLRATRDPAA
ncbi:zf-HC2 domain-containing protein [Nocardia panacis]|uniref:zf-HC2 domain-containing protein n=1 Tax=Nocardia panacis TaxID=2340916 RepID=UPI00131584BF|nr:zf-HC2 domain-containing protein [Nocardia panacis]